MYILLLVHERPRSVAPQVTRQMTRTPLQHSSRDIWGLSEEPLCLIFPSAKDSHWRHPKSICGTCVVTTHIQQVVVHHETAGHLSPDLNSPEPVQASWSVVWPTTTWPPGSPSSCRCRIVHHVANNIWCVL